MVEWFQKSPEYYDPNYLIVEQKKHPAVSFVRFERVQVKDCYWGLKKGDVINREADFQLTKVPWQLSYRYRIRDKTRSKIDSMIKDQGIEMKKLDLPKDKFQYLDPEHESNKPRTWKQIVKKFFEVKWRTEPWKD